MGSQPLVNSRQYDVFRVNCSSIMSAFTVPCICLSTRGYDVLCSQHDCVVSLFWQNLTWGSVASCSVYEQSANS
jgi:hypothetical protein